MENFARHTPKTCVCVCVWGGGGVCVCVCVCVWYSSAQTKGSQCGQRKDGLLPEAVKL